MKKKLKLSDFWYYYKWYILFALLVVWACFNFFLETSGAVEPDAIVSFVTMEQVSPETQARLHQALVQIVGDNNEDGRTEIEINVYAYDGQGSDGSDPEGYAAAAVHLASEIQLQTASFFVTDIPTVFQDADTLEQQGVWSDYRVLNALEDGALSEYRIYGFSGNDALLRKIQ